MKIEDAIERQKRLTAKWESRISELEDVMAKYPFEKMGYEGADWRPLELERRKHQVEESKLIIAALEKQIQKDVLNQENSIFYSGDCPNCRSTVSDIVGPAFCRCCGQALKWSD